MSEEEINMFLYGFPEDAQSIYIRFTEKDLLKGFREEALRHREQLSKALERLGVNHEVVDYVEIDKYAVEYQDYMNSKEV